MIKKGSITRCISRASLVLLLLISQLVSVVTVLRPLKVGADSTASITVQKLLSPTNDSGKFSLSINGSVVASTVGHLGSSAPITVSADQSVTVGEVGVSGTNLADYTTYIECRDQNGQGSVIASGTRPGSTSRTMSFTAASDSEILCQFNNTRKTGELIIEKGLNQDSGGNEVFTDFSFQINGGTPITFDDDGMNELTLPTGTYTVAEVAHPGYTVEYDNCTVTIEEGQSQTCMITNDDIAPVLRFEKKVINDNGGTLIADNFGIAATGLTPIVFGQPTQSSGATSIYTSAGLVYANTPYVITENDTQGYSEGIWSCSNGAIGQDLSVSVTLQPGDDVTCSVTNDDIPPTILVHKVIDHTLYGGSGTPDIFSFMVNGGAPIYFESDGTNSVQVSAGSYEVSEVSNSSYHVTYSDGCEGSLLLGEVATCTITNTSLPARITLNKYVVNDNNGNLDADFVVLLLSNDASVITQTSNGLEVLLAAGNYTASETAVDGYNSSIWSGDCAPNGQITLLNGQSYSCSITNDDIAPTLTLKKVVINDNGGDALANAWTLQAGELIDSKPTIVGETTDGSIAETQRIEAMAHTAYHLAEYDGPDGYDASDWECDGGVVADNTITLQEGEDVTCTISNNDQPPSLIIYKNAEPCTPAESFGFELHIDDELYDEFELTGECGNTSTYSTGKDFRAGIVSIDEELKDNWVLSGVSCYRYGEVYMGDSLQFHAELGVDYDCYIDNAGTSNVIVTKYHDYNQDGQWDEDEPTLPNWTITLTKQTRCYPEITTSSLILVEQEDGCFDENILTTLTNSSGEATFGNLLYGSYAVDEIMQTGWKQSGIVCESEGEPEVVRGIQNFMSYEPANAFKLRAGQTVRCFIGNYRLPQVLIEKSNSTTGPVTTGEEITFTLVVSVPGVGVSGSLQGTTDGETYIPVTVSDYLTDEFDYITGSFNALSNIRGNLRDTGITTDPNYASPGMWKLTSQTSNVMLPGEVVTLTYRAKVTAQAKAGVYETIAKVIGYGDSISITATDNDDDKVSVYIPAVLAATTTRTLAQTGMSANVSFFVGFAIVLFVGVTTLRLQRKSLY
jgi:hypothetical protein